MSDSPVEYTFDFENYLRDWLGSPIELPRVDNLPVFLGDGNTNPISVASPVDSGTSYRALLLPKIVEGLKGGLTDAFPEFKRSETRLEKLVAIRIKKREPKFGGYRFKPQKCSCGHFRDHHSVTSDESCVICHCDGFKLGSFGGVGIRTLEERLQRVLRDKYQKTCPHCHGLFSFSDITHDEVNGRNRFRILCGGCQQIFIQRHIAQAGYADFIKDLEDNPS